MRYGLLLAALAAGCGGPAGTDSGVCDPSGLLAPQDRAALEERAQLFERESGARALFRLAADADPPPPDDPLAGDGRGVTFHYEPGARRLEIEVGYALEGLLPDAHVGEWIDGHVRPLFERGRPATALLLATRMAQERLREFQLEAALEPLSDLPYGSGGAGAADHVLLAGDGPAFATSAFGQEELDPGSSVEQAYDRYLRWLTRGRFEVDAELFTADTRSFLAAWPMTPVYLAHLRDREQGRAYEIIEREDRALLLFTDTPLLGPHLFVRGERGWQIDLAAEAHEVIGIAGGPYTWGLRSRGSAAIAPFADEIIQIDGFLRLRRGDNRRLRPATPWVGPPRPASCGSG